LFCYVFAIAFFTILPHFVASGDFNPIHTNQYFAKLAGLPDTITHGMWLSANAYRVLEKYKHSNQILSFRTDFVLPVKPSDKLNTTLEHVGMREGNLLYELKSAVNGITVLKGFAEVKQEKTAYVFTGQGT
jgi:acyl dehydratase